MERNEEGRGSGSANPTSHLVGKHPWLQLVVGLPLGLTAASVAGITQLAVTRGFQGARSWEETLATPWPGQPLGMVLQIGSSVAVMWLVATKLAQRPLYELSGFRAVREFIHGACIGAAIISASVLSLLIMGHYEVVGVTVGRGLVTGLLLGLGSAFGEEVVIRGVLLRILAGKIGVPAALLMTSVAFGLLHLGNPHSSILGALGVAVQAGILLGAAYLLTHRLWLAIGIHSAWNFMQAAVFDLNVSGVPTETGVLIARLDGPDWLTGGEVGIEGSVITITLGLLVSVIMLFRATSQRSQHYPEEGSVAFVVLLPDRHTE